MTRVVAEVIPFDPFDAVDGVTVTEAWVARQFSQEQSERLAFCHSEGGWFMFDGSVWRFQEKPVAYHNIRELTMRMSSTAKNRSKMQTASYCKGVETFARADPVFARTADDWDKDLFLLGTPGGTVNLRTGEIFEPRRRDMITKMTSVAPEAFEDCGRWESFLHESTGGDAGMIRFLAQICGYALTGDISEQVLFFIFGPGGNGKGVFLSTVQDILGDYSVVASIEALENQKFAQHTTDLAMMRGARLVSASETDEGSAWNEKRIKALTGGEKITARKMRRDNMTFTPQMTLLIIGNHKPALRSVDRAMRRRINMIPFMNAPSEVDTHLGEKLRAEWPGILRWMINGCLDWQANGFVRPDAVVAETAKYFDDQNVMQEWVDTFCEVDFQNDYWWEKSSALFASWSKFATANGVEVGSARTFRPALERMGFNTRRMEAGVHFNHIRLRVAASERTPFE